VFTDGSWESDIAGLGAVLLDESTGNRLVVQDRVQDEFLDLWRDLVGDQLICQIKLFAMVPVRWEWQLELSNRRVLLFVDNNSARSGVVRKADRTAQRWMTPSKPSIRLKSIYHPSGG
jgi:hypothetical protein